MVKMWHRDYTQDVEVYNIDYEKRLATCFCAQTCRQQNGCGWISVKLNKLIPYPYAEDFKTGMSKTQRNKIKAMLSLTYAEWTCTDGTVYDHAHLEDAIQHQAQLIEQEKEEE